MNSIVSVPACFSNPGTDVQVRCTSSWSIPVHPYWLGLCIPLFSFIFKVDVVCHWFHCDCLFLGVYASKVVCAYVYSYFFRRVHLKHFRWIFESCHIIDSLSSWYGIILVYTGSFHYDVTFWCFIHFWDHMEIRLWCICFYFPNLYFWKFSFFLGVTA